MASLQQLKAQAVKPTVLVTSGYPDAVPAELRKHWHVIDIPDQREALGYLRNCEVMPAAMCIGHVTHEPGTLSAYDMLGAVLKLDPMVPVIISTTQNTPGVIVDLVKRGAFDYVVEPRWNDRQGLASYIQDLVLALTRAVQWREVVEENRRLKEERLRGTLPEWMHARSGGMLRVFELVRKVAPTPATVLVTGESGTGKELVARSIHELSGRAAGPFTAINCGAIHQTLLTSELFGHVKGSFTGAESDRPGLIRQAGEGTLFLDEIGTVPMSFQVMLLRVLEQRVARPVGGSEEYPVRCRFIAAANRNLEQMVQAGEFREDLLYRLNLFHIHLPPLRERREDIVVLADFFLREAAERYGKPIVGIEPGVMNLLESYRWPGNVRQLRNAIERAVIVCEGERVGLNDLDPKVRRKSEEAEIAGLSYQQAMRQVERRLIRQALTKAGGNVSEAARLLRLKRTTLHYRMHKLNLVEAVSEGEGEGGGG